VCDERLIEFHRTSVFPLSPEDKLSPEVIKKMEAFDKAMETRLEKKYSLKNKRWKINKDYVQEQSNTPSSYDDGEITPDLFAKLSLEDKSTNPDYNQGIKPLPDVDDIKMGYDNSYYVSANVSIPKDGYQVANDVAKRWARDERTGFLLARTTQTLCLIHQSTR
jgi:hypothetical protein